MEVFENTKVCAVIGNPVAHSLSPRIQNAAFQHLKLNYVYVAFNVSRKNLESALQGIRALGIHGINVTMPLKTQILPHLDMLDPNAERIGAVNTVLNKEGILIGYNTDAFGSASALREHNEYPRNKRLVILGSGGAARAVSFALAKDSIQTVILNRTVEKARVLAEELKKLFGEKIRYAKLNQRNLKKEVKDADILINATPIGMYPSANKTPVNQELLRTGLTVFDLVYNPPETRLLREAKAVGAPTIGGAVMLVHQAAASFEIWTGKKAPIGVMMKACQEGIRELGWK